MLISTLSDFGSVTRGVCKVSNGKLSTVIETENLRKLGELVSSNRNIILNGTEPVSMNMWGFTPKLFNYLDEMIIEFLDLKGSELKSEFLIPSVINDLITTKKEAVMVLKSNSSWFGVTFKEDKPFVLNEIKKMVDAGIYPENLFA